MSSIVYLAAGFALLVWGADQFVSGASAAARKIGVPPLVIGLTIVAFGTSAPRTGSQRDRSAERSKRNCGWKCAGLQYFLICSALQA